MEKFSKEQLENLDNLDYESQEKLDKLKEIYSLVLDEPFKSKLARVRTHEEFVGVVGALAEEGKRIKFQVKEVFRGDKQDTLDVWTGFGGGDCGFLFQKGETYLVYAGHDGRRRLTTDICSRTRRL